MTTPGQLPDGHHTITPSVIVPGAAGLIDFLVEAFGAKLVDRYEGPGGTIAHAEVRIGDSALMLGEPMEGWVTTPGVFALYVDDVEAIYRKAMALGSTSLRPPEKQFYGHFTASVLDPFGNRWTISRVVEDVSDEEMHARVAKMGS